MGLLALLAVSYFIAGKAGLLLAIGNASVSAIWPATGIGIAALLLGGLDLWPAIIVAAFLVNLTTTGDIPTSVGIGVGNTLEVLVGAYLTGRFASGTLLFQKPKDVLTFVLLGGLVAATVAATVGVTTLTLGGLASLSSFPTLWATWWLGDAIGAIEAASVILILAWEVRRPHPRSDPKRLLEGAALGGVTLITAVLLFDTSWVSPTNTAPLAVLVLPPVVWAAFRFGPLGGSLSMVSVSVVALLATAEREGPFSILPAALSLLELRLFIGALVITTLLVAASVLERERSDQALSQAQHALELRVLEGSASLASAMALAHLGSWEYDLEKGEVRWSDEMYRLYGYGDERFPLTLERALERVPPEDRVTITNDLRAGLRAEDPLNFSFPMATFHVVFPDGQRRSMVGRGKVTEMRDGKPIRLVGTVLDITDQVTLMESLQRKTDDLLAINRDLERFGHVVSHELKEPLRTVTSYSSLLKRKLGGQLDADSLELLRFLEEGALNLSGLVDDLLAFSAASSTLQPLQLVSSEACYRKAEEALRAALADSHGEVQLLTELPQVRADATQLTQVFQNLLANALKFHAEAPPRVEVSCHRDGPEWVFSVRDHGIGIPQEVQPRIFEAFFRVHSRETFAGTGMGLALCRRIVERHGGRIWLESPGRPGEGSTFRFSLPVDGPTEAAAPRLGGPAAGGTAGPSPRRPSDG